jgi:hypothetical protein
LHHRASSQQCRDIVESDITLSSVQLVISPHIDNTSAKGSKHFINLFNIPATLFLKAVHELERDTDFEAN